MARKWRKTRWKYSQLSTLAVLKKKIKVKRSFQISLAVRRELSRIPRDISRIPRRKKAERKTQGRRGEGGREGGGKKEKRRRNTAVGGCKRTTTKVEQLLYFDFCGRLLGIVWADRRCFVPVSDVKTRQKKHPWRIYLFRTCQPRQNITPISRIATNGGTATGRFKTAPNSMPLAAYTRTP